MKIIATAVLTLSLALTVGCGQTPSGTPKKAANAAGATASDWDHNGNWSSPEIHGKAFFEATASERKSCLHCHNGTTSGYNTGPKCTSCHANFPHNENWMDHSNHGKTFLTSNDLDKGKCLSCHTATKPRSGVSCSDCHDQFPAMHTDDFKAGEHGVVVRHSGSESCVSCHTATIQDLPKLSNIACATCHSGAFPHGEKWGEHSNHGKTFLTSKDSEKADCLSCHKASDPQTKVTCAKCHTAFPHTAEFLKGSGPNGHGQFIKQTNAAGQKPLCAECHSAVIADLPQYQGKLGCFTTGCHHSAK